MTSILLDPLRSEAIEAGDRALLAAWRVSEGDRVHAGQALAQVSVLGESVDILAPHAGVVEEILVPAG
jgi:pyruvate dehydrogenase E2 component (dihydrolipoamide acetyltransferase)